MRPHAAGQQVISAQNAQHPCLNHFQPSPIQCHKVQKMSVMNMEISAARKCIHFEAHTQQALAQHGVPCSV